MNRHLLLAAAAILTFGSTAWAAIPLKKPAPGPLSLRAVPEGWTLVRGADGRSVAWLEGPRAKVSEPRPEELWRVLDELGPHLGLASPRTELVLDRGERDALGMHHVWFRRVHHGTPVVESGLVLHFDRDGTLVTVNGRYPASFQLAPLNMTLDRQPLVDRAIEAAKVAARARGESVPGFPRRAPEVREVIWPDPPREAVEVLVDLAVHQRWKVYVDVVRGTPLAVRNLVHTDAAATGKGVDSKGVQRTLRVTHFTDENVYGMLDGTNGTGAARLGTLNANYQESYDVGLFSSVSKDSGWDPAAVDVHANMRVVYDYFKDTHGRSSWDGRGADVLSIVHFGSNYANAFWNGELMAFGDGDGYSLVKPHYCLDVAAHELSHAVIQETAGLIYENQSGALNEHFADVFGVLVDAANWNMGEHCVGPYFTNQGVTTLRSMSNPAEGGQPGHMDDYQDLPNTEDGDHGGVHINSGIPNRAAYLVGTRTSRATLGQVWYRILAQGYLNERSQFLDLRRAAMRACTDLFSTGTTCTEVGKAFDDVGLRDASGGGGSCPPNSHAESGGCVCDAGYRPNAAGTGCEPVGDANCPPNSTQYGEYCYCNQGYEVNAAGTGCVLAGTECPSNSSRVGGKCVCDDGYQGSPTSDQGCQPKPISCPLNSRPTADGNSCECLPGWTPNQAGTACEPGASGCGDETYFGRCQQNVLVYCNADKIELIDCGANGSLCALQSAEVGNNCVSPTAGCGDVTYFGECVGNVARWCQDDVLKQMDCQARPCVYLNEDYGYACDPCTENAAWRDGAGGRGCYCNDGFVAAEDGKSCQPDDTTAPDAGTGPDAGQAPDAGTESPDGGTEAPDAGAPSTDGSSRDRGRSSGCDGAGASGAGLWLLLLPLAWGRRRALAAFATVLALGCAHTEESPAPDETANSQPLAGSVATRPQPTPVGKAPPAAAPEQKPLPDDAITLQAEGEWTSDDGAVKLVVRDVIEVSSPCPPGAKCVWSGVLRQVVFDVTMDEETEALRLNERATRTLGDWRLEVLRIAAPSVSFTLRKVMVAPVDPQE